MWMLQTSPSSTPSNTSMTWYASERPCLKKLSLNTSRWIALISSINRGEDKRLGALEVNLGRVKVVGEPEAQKLPSPQERKRVLLFAGHMIDAPGREKPRFPADKEAIARERIREAVVKEMNTGAGIASAYAGGANGGDILFQEVC